MRQLLAIIDVDQQSIETTYHDNRIARRDQFASMRAVHDSVLLQVALSH